MKVVSRYVYVVQGLVTTESPCKGAQRWERLANNATEETADLADRELEAIRAAIGAVEGTPCAPLQATGMATWNRRLRVLTIVTSRGGPERARARA